MPRLAWERHDGALVLVEPSIEFVGRVFRYDPLGPWHAQTTTHERPLAYDYADTQRRAKEIVEATLYSLSGVSVGDVLA